MIMYRGLGGVYDMYVLILIFSRVRGCDLLLTWVYLVCYSYTSAISRILPARHDIIVPVLLSPVGYVQPDEGRYLIISGVNRTSSVPQGKADTIIDTGTPPMKE